MAPEEEQSATVEEIAAANLNGDGPEDDGTAQLVIPGTGSKLSLSAGGERPTTSEVTLRGGKIAVEGQFENGDIIELTVVGEVSMVSFPRTERNGLVSVVRRHQLRVIGVHRDAEEATE